MPGVGEGPPQSTKEPVEIKDVRGDADLSAVESVVENKPTGLKAWVASLLSPFRKREPSASSETASAPVLTTNEAAAANRSAIGGIDSVEPANARLPEDLRSERLALEALVKSGRATSEDKKRLEEVSGYQKAAVPGSQVGETAESVRLEEHIKDHSTLSTERPQQDATEEKAA